MATRGKHPFLFIQESVKVWVSDDSVPEPETEEGNSGRQRRVLPPPVGELDNPLSFPLYMVRDPKGKDKPAGSEVWDAMLLHRLLHGGDYEYHTELTNPSEIYCRQLLNYHYSKLDSSAQYKFASYLRPILETEQAELDQKIYASQHVKGEGHASENAWLVSQDQADMRRLLVDAWQVSYDLMQYCLNWLDKESKKLKNELLNAPKMSNGAARVTGKVKTLAYLILIKSGLAPPLSREASSDTQRNYIVEKTGLDSRTVEQYMRATLDWRPNYFIYTRDNKVNALDYIETLFPDIDRSALKYPLELRGTV
ncbi:hypothetical protein KB206_02185 [Microvirga sp. STS02]|uniref:hypothetical protein n=1 Tax=Hymenobacter negativus TaxID=2795026 RepID=UPI0018DB02AE|nr:MULTISPECIES: hypothetical protein [Bacteria]MBH8567675.1 hypothetical protein [Hymenobacter negativus]MBR7207409.1 hypothetical protein [Microvirga sp. STS02]